MENKIIAIIPARGGSKRIPRKNVREFCGQPIIKYSIDTAIASGLFDTIMVSTDDSEIAEISRSLGAEVPFMRTSKNADDQSTLTDVLREVLLEYDGRGKDFVYFCCILPTAPFLSVSTLRQGFNVLQATNADSVIPVVRFSYPIQRALKIESDGRLHMFNPENYSARSQDLEPAYHDCGQFYWMKTKSLIEQMRAFAKHTVAIVLPESEVQDIDEEEDWKLAELKYKLVTNKAVQ